MLLNMAAEIIERLQKEFQEADPAEKERFVKKSLSLLQVLTGELKK